MEFHHLNIHPLYSGWQESRLKSWWQYTDLFYLLTKWLNLLTKWQSICLAALPLLLCSNGIFGANILDGWVKMDSTKPNQFTWKTRNHLFPLSFFLPTFSSHMATFISLLWFLVTLFNKLDYYFLNSKQKSATKSITIPENSLGFSNLQVKPSPFLITFLIHSYCKLQHNQEPFSASFFL